MLTEGWMNRCSDIYVPNAMESLMHQEIEQHMTYIDSNTYEPVRTTRISVCRATDHAICVTATLLTPSSCP